MDEFMLAALNEAKEGLKEGGLAIGSVLVLDGEIVGRGRNQSVQKGSVILHAETDAIENAGELTAEEYRRSVLYTTLSPCPMCSGAIVFCGIQKVVVGEDVNFRGAPEFLELAGVERVLLNDPECIQLLSDSIRVAPGKWEKK